MGQKIKMLYCKGYLTEKDFAGVERLLAVKLPDQCKNFIKSCDGGVPERDCIVFVENNGDVKGTCIGVFLSFQENFPYEGEQMIGFFRKPAEGFPNNLIAFAVDPGGNYFCFDYREGKDNPNPPIVFWNHEGAGTEEAVSFLAKDFEGFLKMLKSEEEADREYEELKKQQEDTSK